MTVAESLPMIFFKWLKQFFTPESSRNGMYFLSLVTVSQTPTKWVYSYRL